MEIFVRNSSALKKELNSTIPRFKKYVREKLEWKLWQSPETEMLELFFCKWSLEDKEFDAYVCGLISNPKK